MARRDLTEAAVLIVLVTAGATLRIAFRELPNFAPVAALALFAGYYFRSQVVAAAAPLCVMVISDWVIGTYAWQMMALVYAALIFPVALRTPLRRYLSMDSQSSLTRSVIGLVTCSLGASVAFFLVTNFGSWLWFDMYPRGPSGLLQSYAAGLPFFRFTVMGDLGFACLLFSAYALAVQWGWEQRVTSSREPSLPERSS